MAWTFEPSGHPVEFLSLTGKLGSQVRATVSSFGPLLLGKVLDLNETQTSILALVFKYCDDNDLPLLDLKDLATTLKFLSSDEGKPILADYGGMSAASVGVLLRSIVVLEQEGADIFFGEPEFDVDDLLRTTPEGLGIISILELSDVMDQPRLFSTFMLWMLAKLYEELPEAGDLPKPKLCFFFDEAHLLFNDASDALMEQIERTARLIRSKGVGIYFVTQVPADVPSSVLAQLGNRVQHALRAFTPEDADNLRKAARTFPMTEFYDVETTLTSLGTGEALVTVLSPKGIPTPLAATRLIPPDSLMAPVEEVVFRGHIAMSPLQAKYGATVDRDSAHERITARIAAARQAAIAATQEAAVRAGVDPTTAAGMNSMTPAQVERELKRQQKEIEAAQARAEREAERQRRAEEKAAIAAAKARQRSIDTRRADRRQGRDLAPGTGHRPWHLRDALRRREVALSRWADPDWRAATLDWATAQLSLLGWSVTGEITQPHIRPWSTAFRIPTDMGVAWCKASGPGPAYEGPLLAAFDRWGVRGALLPLATDPGRALILTPDGGPTMRDTRPDGNGDHDLAAWARILRGYAHLQRSMEGRAAELVAMGVPDMRPEHLVAVVEGFVADDAIWARADAEDRDAARAARRRLPGSVAGHRGPGRRVGGDRGRGHDPARRPAWRQHPRGAGGRPRVRLGRRVGGAPVHDADHDPQLDRVPDRSGPARPRAASTPRRLPGGVDRCRATRRRWSPPRDDRASWVRSAGRHPGSARSGACRRTSSRTTVVPRRPGSWSSSSDSTGGPRRDRGRDDHRVHASGPCRRLGA